MTQDHSKNMEKSKSRPSSGRGKKRKGIEQDSIPLQQDAVSRHGKRRQGSTDGDHTSISEHDTEKQASRLLLARVWPVFAIISIIGYAMIFHHAAVVKIWANISLWNLIGLSPVLLLVAGIYWVSKAPDADV